MGESRESLIDVLNRHAAGATSPAETACRCDRTWRPSGDYRAHVADAILASDWFADVLTAERERIAAAIEAAPGLYNTEASKHYARIARGVDHG